MEKMKEGRRPQIGELVGRAGRGMSEVQQSMEGWVFGLLKVVRGMVVDK